MPRNKSQPELLAPAGDWEALRAALANGADAVYFGLPLFNARRRATNFTLAELPEVMAHLHRHNARGYVTVNTLVFSGELAQAATYLAAIAAAGADAVIVQDLGIARLARQLAPTLPIHASTQMTLTEPRGTRLAQRLGISRVILARELPLEEIAALAATQSVEPEVFVHGALCISYSGQCHASQSLFGRSANRGLCAQACRLPYELVIAGGRPALGPHGRAAGPFLLSPQDLAAYDLVAELAGAGVVALKIEGRMKGPHYVAAAVDVYRAALDALAAGRRFEIRPEQLGRLEQAFSRGFTHGWLKGADHRGLVRGAFPGSRGQRVGVVVELTRRGVIVELDCPVKPGDGVLFDLARPGADNPGGRVYAASRLGGRRVLLELGNDVDLAAIERGAVVWKTDDPALRRQLEQSYARVGVRRPVKVDFRVEAEVGRPLRLTALDPAGRKAAVESSQPMEAAREHPLTTALLREQLGRLGETPFGLGAVELIADGRPAASSPVMAPKSVLNELRRQATAALVEQRLASARHAVAEPGALETLRAAAAARAGATAATAAEQAQVHVLVRQVAQLQAVAEWRAASPASPLGAVWLDMCEWPDVERAVALGRANGLSIGLAGPRILRLGEESILRRVAELAPAAMLVRNLGSISLLREIAPALPLVADDALNVANELSADWLMGLGLSRLTPSLDLDRPGLLDMARRTNGTWFEAPLRRRVPLFHMEYCLFAAHLGCGRCRRKDDNSRPHSAAGATCGEGGAKRLFLRDRIGEEHPVFADLAGRCTVFRSKAQDDMGFLAELLAAGVRHFRLEFVDEPAEEVQAALDQACQGIRRQEA